jgi:hypothetical protein
LDAPGEAVLGWPQIQQGPGHSGFRLPTERTFPVFKMPWLTCPFVFQEFPGIVPSEKSTGAKERNFSPHNNYGTVWHWNKE